MSKTVAFKQPQPRPTAEDWVERRTLESAVVAMPIQAQAPTSVSADVHPPVTQAAALAPKAMMKRALCRLSADVDEQIRARIKILCVRTRVQQNDFLAKAIEDALVRAELELENSEG